MGLAELFGQIVDLGLSERIARPSRQALPSGGNVPPSRAQLLHGLDE